MSVDQNCAVLPSTALCGMYIVQSSPVGCASVVESNRISWYHYSSVVEDIFIEVATSRDVPIVSEKSRGNALSLSSPLLDEEVTQNVPSLPGQDSA